MVFHHFISFVCVTFEKNPVTLHTPQRQDFVDNLGLANIITKAETELESLRFTL